MTVGSTISARVIMPARSDTPMSRKITRKAKPKRPKTIEGVPLRRSTPVRISFVTLPSRVYSTR